MTVHLLLIRHARSTANADGILGGRLPGVHLDNHGITQAEQLAVRLSDTTIARIVGSPLERCKETAEPLCITKKLRYEVDERLSECDYGQWSGRLLTECAKDPLWADIQARPSSVVFPGGEAMLAMQARAVAALDGVVERAEDGSVVAVFSHGDVIKALIAHVLDMPLDRFQRLIIDPASISIARAHGAERSLVRFNDSLTPLPDLFSDSVLGVVGGGVGSAATGQTKPE